MGYFDALASSSFKIAPDGRRLFFPWGVLGRGYVIGSEPDYERLRRQITIYNIVALALIVGTLALVGFPAGLVVAAVLIVLYVARTLYLLRGMQPSDERLSLQESLTAQASAHNPTTLWLLEIASLAFVGMGIFLFLAEPDNRLIALATIAFFGFCAASIAFMLVVRRRTFRSAGL